MHHLRRHLCALALFVASASARSKAPPKTNRTGDWAFVHEIDERMTSAFTPCDAACKEKLPPISALGRGFLNTIQHAVLGTLYKSPGDGFTFRSCKTERSLPCHTMLTPYSLANFANAVEYVVANGIAGDVVELGVWRGGGCMYVKALLETLGEGSRRDVHLFDVFDTQTLYTRHEFKSIFGKIDSNSVSAISEAFLKMGLLDSHIKFHPGLFGDTASAHRLAANPQRPIAVLRVDGNVCGWRSNSAPKLRTQSSPLFPRDHPRPCANHSDIIRLPLAV